MEAVEVAEEAARQQKAPIATKTGQREHERRVPNERTWGDARLRYFTLCGGADRIVY
jgi:hypothetical protein